MGLGEMIAEYLGKVADAEFKKMLQRPPQWLRALTEQVRHMGVTLRAQDAYMGAKDPEGWRKAKELAEKEQKKLDALIEKEIEQQKGAIEQKGSKVKFGDDSATLR